MKLSEAKEGQDLEVCQIDSPEIMMQALRFGIDTGARIFVEKNIHGGPVIVCKNQLEIAIGREIAKSIEVMPRGVQNVI